MFKKFILLSLILAPVTGLTKNLSPQELRDRLEIRADIYIVDADGKRILSGPEASGLWKAGTKKT